MLTYQVCLNDGGRSQSKRTKQNNDCTVVCTAIAFNMKYDDAFDFLQLHGRTNNKGINYSAFLRKYPDKWTPVIIPPYVNLTKIMHLVQKGKYIVLIKGHVYCIIDGVIQDCNPVNVYESVFSVFKVVGDITINDILI